MSESKSSRTRLLIANRGEIAVRIVRAAHSLGIETVLAASAHLERTGAARVERPAIVA